MKPPGEPPAGSKAAQVAVDLVMAVKRFRPRRAPSDKDRPKNEQLAGLIEGIEGIADRLGDCIEGGIDDNLTWDRSQPDAVFEGFGAVVTGLQMRGYCALADDLQERYSEIEKAAVLFDTISSTSINGATERAGHGIKLVKAVPDMRDKLRDIAALLRRQPQAVERRNGATPAGPTGKGGRKPVHDVAFWRRVRATYDEYYAQLGGKGAWNKAAETHGLKSGEAARKQCARYLEEKRNRGQN
ncbi:MAG: hypothetical protein JW955_18980 [Sedimentisphaerales bacterium]|nr:hypothetical protein [Sedimentisphaerales bacterium]